MTAARRRGFTMIELMIVVAIIGILAAIAIPKFAELVRKSKEGSSKGNLGTIRSAMSVYYADMDGQYPASLPALTLNGKYLAAIPLAKTPDYHPETSAPLGGSQAAFAGTDLGRWYMDNVATDVNVGTVWVACTHTDTKGSVWTEY